MINTITGIENKKVIISLIVIFCVIMLVTFKLPIMCYGCDSPKGLSKYIFRCVVDTAQDSPFCKMTTNYNRKISKSNTDEVNSLIFSRQVFAELTTNIPATISDALLVIIQKIESVGNDIKSNLVNFSVNFKKYIDDTFNALQKELITSYNDFVTKAIIPILTWFITYIIDPINILVEYLLKFKQQIILSITNVSKNLAGPLLKINNSVVSDVKNISNGVTNLLKIFSTSVNSNDVVKSANSFINNINNDVNSTTNSANTITNMISNGINDTINNIKSSLTKLENVNILGYHPFEISPPRNNTNENFTLNSPTQSIEMNTALNTIGTNMESTINIINSSINASIGDAFDPLDKIIQEMLALISTFYTAIITSINNGDVNKLMSNMAREFENGVTFSYGECINIIMNNLIDPTLKILINIENDISDGISVITNTLSTTIHSLITKISELFDSLSDSFFALGKFTLNNAWYITYFGFGQLCDSIIPFNISITKKMNVIYFLLLTLIIVLIYGLIKLLVDSSIIIMTMLAILMIIFITF